MIPEQNAGYKRPTKRKRSEAKKDELFATCIKALQEPPPNLESVPKVSSFAKYVDEKLKNLDNRSRTLAEKRITDVLFDLEMGNEINSQPPSQTSHPPQFRQFSSGQFISMLTREEHYY